VKGSRVPALLAGLAAALTLAACGVPPSDVIQAGDPASGMFSPTPKPPVPAAVSLYFLNNDDLTPYARKIAGSPDLPGVLRMLFEGPVASEAVTATTELPRLTVAPEVRIDNDNTVVIQLPQGVPHFSRLAMRQLECTVADGYPAAPLPADADRAGAAASSPADAGPSAAHPSVQVLGDGWTMTQSDGSCPDPLEP
jgi:hypothetical protein